VGSHRYFYKYYISYKDKIRIARTNWGQVQERKRIDIGHEEYKKGKSYYIRTLITISIHAQVHNPMQCMGCNNNLDMLGSAAASSIVGAFGAFVVAFSSGRSMKAAVSTLASVHLNPFCTRAVLTTEFPAR
jgi:hypothetical protein